MKFDVFVLENEASRIGINPDGGYVTSWQAKRGEEWVDVLYVGSEKKRGGIPVLFPYFGKAEKWPQHGFGRNCVWSVIEQSSGRVVMELRADEVNAEVRAWYPYDFISRIEVEIGSEGEMVYSLMVENFGDVEMPISPGLHPYWAIEHEQKKNVKIEGVENFVASEFDWDTAPPDNVYDFSKKAVVCLPDKKVVIEDASIVPVVKHVVVWSLTPVRDQDFDFICIEPIVGWNYSIDKDPVWIKFGESWEMKVKFSVE